MAYLFEAELWRYPGEGGWHFLTLPPDVADDIRDRTASDRRGFGSAPVVVTIGDTTWPTSVFPDPKSGSYVLPVKKQVRRDEGLDDGVDVTVTLVLDDRRSAGRSGA